MRGQICPPSFPILSAWAYEFSFQKSTREAPVSVCLERYSLENPVSVMSCFFPWAAIAVDMSPSTAVRSVAGVLIPSLQKGVNARNPSRLARTASPDGFLNSSHEHVNIRGAPQWNKCSLPIAESPSDQPKLFSTTKICAEYKLLPALTILPFLVVTLSETGFTFFVRYVIGHPSELYGTYTEMSQWKRFLARTARSFLGAVQE